MNGLDQAFIKAFAKNHAPATLQRPLAAVREQVQPPVEGMKTNSLVVQDWCQQEKRFRVDKPNADILFSRPHLFSPFVEQRASYDPQDIGHLAQPSVMVQDHLLPLDAVARQDLETPPADDGVGSASDAQEESDRAQKNQVASPSTLPLPPRGAANTTAELPLASNRDTDSSRSARNDRVESPWEQRVFEACRPQQQLATPQVDAPHLMTHELGYPKQPTAVSASALSTLLEIRVPSVDLSRSATVAEESLAADHQTVPGAGLETSAAPPAGTDSGDTESFAEQSAVIPEDELAAVISHELDEMASEAMELRPFTPAWEVDLFRWPEICQQLDETTGGRLAQSGRELYVAARDGLRVLAITSACREEGRSSVTLALARAVALSGCQVALVDGDAAHPELARRLGVEAPCDWREVMWLGQPLEEAAVASLSDRVTLFPRTPSAGVEAEEDRSLAKLLDALRERFELVIVDLPPQDSPPRRGAGDLLGPIDMAVVVRDVKSTPQEESLSAVTALRAQGVRAVGLIENFAPSD